METLLLTVTLTFTLVEQISAAKTSMFINEHQAAFAASLGDYQIARPRLSLTEHVNMRRLTWEELTSTLPKTVYIKLRLKNSMVKLRLHRNTNFLSEDYSLEDVGDDYSSAKPRRKANLQGDQPDCYYSGYVLQKANSRVALSTCNGLRGFFSIANDVQYIEPMRQFGNTFMHLIYESKAELNSTYNFKQGRTLTCSTGKHVPYNHQDLEDEITSQDEAREFEGVDAGTHRIARRSTDDLSNMVPNQNATFQSKFFPQTATIEVFVVVDKYMVAFHGNDSLQNYVLTMMNMVNDMYKDQSLGMQVNVVVAKVLVLHHDVEHLNISHNGDRTLFSFCEWQFLTSLTGNRPNDPDSIFSYDVALLLTRKDVCANSDRPCGTIGLAYINGMCSTNRKCSVVEDIGLNTAYTIAHEIGHTLGMTHDGEDNSCGMESSGHPHMMASQWPSGNYVGSMKWSECSRRKLYDFLESYKSFCIRDKSPVSKSLIANDPPNLPKLLPGKLYDADTQCKQQYGAVAKHCQYFKTTGHATDLCQQLWCEIEEEEECVSKLDPAARGTPCGQGKWCMYGKCVNNTQIPDPVDGGWGEWSNWTQCSRSCGVGARYMERFCNRPLPRNGGRYCVGESRQYRTCNTDDCPPHSRDIRILQCEQYNNRTFQYMPVHSPSQPCALHCRPRVVGAHYSIRFQQKVIDGTPCRHGAEDVCIDGQCETLGCDKKLNSKLHKDVCGVCGGNGTTCNLVEGEFTQPLGEGYVNAVDIPQGAKNVLVKEVKPCASFLALKSGHGTFHINGNWTIELPGKFDVNGTVVYYKRSGTQEMFYTEGPTKTRMQFMVLFQDFNFGVKYRYVLPLNNSDDEQESRGKYGKGTFGWMQGQWDKCSVECGGGIMNREKARCLFMSGQNISIVDDELCSGAKMPPSPVKTCNEHKCPKVWFVTPWGPCSQSCGLGRMKRNVSCKEQEPDGSWRNLTDGCPVEEKPVHIQTCVLKSCFLSWRVGSWSQCRAKCGQAGHMYRSVTCPIAGACLTSSKPGVARACQSPDCEYKWMAEAWSACSKTCGGGTQVRSVTCREMQSMKIHNDQCDALTMPSFAQPCSVGDCNFTHHDNAPNRTNSDGQRSMATLGVQVLSSKINFRTPRKTRLRNTPGGLSSDLEDVNDPCYRATDLLPTWACSMLLATEKSKNFCKTENGEKKCCSFCQSFLSKTAQVKGKDEPSILVTLAKQSDS